MRSGGQSSGAQSPLVSYCFRVIKVSRAGIPKVNRTVLQTCNLKRGLRKFAGSVVVLDSDEAMN